MAFWRGDWFNALTPVFEAKLLGMIVNYFSSFHVYTFTLVSGFIYYHVKYHRDGYNIFSSFIQKKAKRLLVPYVFVAIVWAIPFYIAFYHPDIVDVLKKYGLGESPSQLWFLLMLFEVFALSWVLSDIYRKVKWSVFVPLVFYIIAVLGSSMLPNVFNIWNACRHLIMFWLGFKFCQYGMLNRVKVWQLIAVFSIHMMLFVVLTIISGRDGSFWILAEKGVEMFVRISGAVMAFSVLQFFGEIVNWKDSKIFVDFSKKSMPIYLFHQQLIYLTIWLLNGKINPYLNVFINFVFAVTVAYGISSLLMSSRVTRFLIGEK